MIVKNLKIQSAVYARTLAFAAVGCFFFALGLAPIYAQAPTKPTPNPNEPRLAVSNTYDKPTLQATPIAFTGNDFIRAIRSSVKSEYFLGEPVDLSIRVINHTDFKISVMTNVNPRSQLEVMIQPLSPRPDREHQYFGPYNVGNYAPSPLAMNPLDEYPLRVMLWGDLLTPNSLAFPEPGEYMVKMSIKIGAELSRANGSIPLEPFKIKVKPAPPEVAPLIEELMKTKAFADLQLRKVPEGAMARWEELADKYPNTALTPYMNYALGLLHYTMMVQKQNNLDEFDKANLRLQKAAKADSPYKVEILDSMVHLYDRVGVSDLAQNACNALINAAAPEVAVREASTAIVRKYLGNTAQMDPLRYWDLLE